jgi:hypothetical protein
MIHCKHEGCKYEATTDVGYCDEHYLKLILDSQIAINYDNSSVTN